MDQLTIYCTTAMCSALYSKLRYNGGPNCPASITFYWGTDNKSSTRMTGNKCPKERRKQGRDENERRDKGTGSRGWMSGLT